MSKLDLLLTSVYGLIFEMFIQLYRAKLCTLFYYWFVFDWSGIHVSYLAFFGLLCIYFIFKHSVKPFDLNDLQEFTHIEFISHKLAKFAVLTVILVIGYAFKLSF